MNVVQGVFLGNKICAVLRNGQVKRKRDEQALRVEFLRCIREWNTRGGHRYDVTRFRFARVCVRIHVHAVFIHTDHVVDRRS